MDSMKNDLLWLNWKFVSFFNANEVPMSDVHLLNDVETEAERDGDKTNDGKIVAEFFFNF